MATGLYPSRVASISWGEKVKRQFGPKGDFVIAASSFSPLQLPWPLFASLRFLQTEFWTTKGFEWQFHPPKYSLERSSKPVHKSDSKEM